MFKVPFCLLALAITSVICIPIESSSSTKGLDRPSHINPDVISELPPISTASPTTQSNVQKVPAKGTKLSSELPAEKKHKRDVESSESESEPETVQGHSTSTTTSRTSSVASNDDENDNSGPHFVRPVPVDQILQKIHSTTRHHHKVETTTASLESSTTETAKKVDNHKVHQVKVNKKEEPKEKKEQPKAKKEEDREEEDSSKDDNSNE